MAEVVSYRQQADRGLLGSGERSAKGEEIESVRGDEIDDGFVEESINGLGIWAKDQNTENHYCSKKLFSII
jgi:collagenase-like PrtC family protease